MFLKNSKLHDEKLILLQISRCILKLHRSVYWYCRVRNRATMAVNHFERLPCCKLYNQKEFQFRISVNYCKLGWTFKCMTSWNGSKHIISYRCFESDKVLMCAFQPSVRRRFETFKAYIIEIYQYTPRVYKQVATIFRELLISHASQERNNLKCRVSQIYR